MIDIRPVLTDMDSLREYRNLFERCFPSAKHLNELYLHWLYCENPEGMVVGFDAWDNDKLCAHYVCIPVSTEILGKPRRALLSLNTATHPEYQGRGLFTKLAERVYEVAAEVGYECVYGIANANSTPGFTRKLGFSCIGALDAKLGIGRVAHACDTIDRSRLGDLAFRRLWSAEAFDWRSANPHNRVVARANYEGQISAFTSSRHVGIHAYAEIPVIEGVNLSDHSKNFALRLFLGTMPAWEKMSTTYASIPKVLRPSPLNFIFRNLGADNLVPHIQGTRISFLDFDAY